MNNQRRVLYQALEKEKMSSRIRWLRGSHRPVGDWEVAVGTLLPCGDGWYTTQSQRRAHSSTETVSWRRKGVAWGHRPRGCAEIQDVGRAGEER